MLFQLVGNAAAGIALVKPVVDKALAQQSAACFAAHIAGDKSLGDGIAYGVVSCIPAVVGC